VTREKYSNEKLEEKKFYGRNVALQEKDFRVGREKKSRKKI